MLLIDPHRFADGKNGYPVGMDPAKIVTVGWTSVFRLVDIQAFTREQYETVQRRLQQLLLRTIQFHKVIESGRKIIVTGNIGGFSDSRVPFPTKNVGIVPQGAIVVEPYVIPLVYGRQSAMLNHLREQTDIPDLHVCWLPGNIHGLHVMVTRYCITGVQANMIREYVQEKRLKMQAIFMEQKREFDSELSSDDAFTDGSGDEIDES